MMTSQAKVLEKSVTFRMDEDDYREIERIALESGVSIAWVLRYAIRQFLEARPKQLKLL
jgi:predicted transcriptional regulator